MDRLVLKKKNIFTILESTKIAYQNNKSQIFFVDMKDKILVIILMHNNSVKYYLLKVKLKDKVCTAAENIYFAKLASTVLTLI